MESGPIADGSNDVMPPSRKTSLLVHPEGGHLFFGHALSNVKDQLDRILAAERRLGSSLPPVLIAGETGTGKSTVARWLHRHGPRAKRKLVELNCSTLPDTLAESELFGHERGAFTDARKTRAGLFEAADQGTLLLDEAPSLTAVVQAKLLMAIEDGKIRRVGGNDDLAVDVRVVATANTDLRELVARGEFREDLYHRLNLLTLNLPPLRERGLDILALANHLLRRLAQRYQSSVSAISADQESFLREYSWPGNVRELMHELERQLVWNGGEQLDFSHLSLEKSQAAQQPSCPLPPPSLRLPTGWRGDGGSHKGDSRSRKPTTVLSGLRWRKPMATYPLPPGCTG